MLGPWSSQAPHVAPTDHDASQRAQRRQEGAPPGERARSLRCPERPRDAQNAPRFKDSLGKCDLRMLRSLDQSEHSS